MTFNPPDSNPSIPSRRVHRPWQIQPYSSLPKHQQICDSLDFSDQDPRSQITSVPRRKGFSLNLLSLISKFEALDALSLPIQFPTLRPAPLQVSPNYSRHEETEASRRGALLTIFNLKSESQDVCTPIVSRTSGPDDVFGPTSSRISYSAPKTRKLRKVQVYSKPSSIKQLGGVWGRAESEDMGGITALFVESKAPNKKRNSIQDMVRLYDGSKYQTTTLLPVVILAELLTAKCKVD